MQADRLSVAFTLLIKASMQKHPLLKTPQFPRNHTLLSATYWSRPNKGVHPSPPPPASVTSTPRPLRNMSHNEKDDLKQNTEDLYSRRLHEDQEEQDPRRRPKKAFDELQRHLY